MRRLRRLLAKRAARSEEGAFVVEGPEVLRTALDAAVPVEAVFLGAGAAGRPEIAELADRAHHGGARVFALAPGVLERVADTVTPQPLLAVVPLPRVDPAAALAGGALVVVAVDVRDPGNAGTLVRTADAAGATAIVFSGTSVDPYNPKVVRSSAGSVFHLPLLVEPDPVAALGLVAAAGYRSLGAVVGDATDYTQVDWTVPSALVLGNEAEGLDEAVLRALDGTVAIPMEGRAESLNVGMAGAVICFEALRQRRARGAAVRPRGAGGDSTMPGMEGADVG